MIGDLVREVALPDALGAGEQLVDRSGDRLRERGAGDERDDFDDEEQPADHDEQDEQQRLAERPIADHALRGGDPPVDVLKIQLRRDEQRAWLAAVPVVVVEERHPAERTAPGASARRRRRRRGAADSRRAFERPGRAAGHADRRHAAQVDAGVAAQAVS